MLEFYVVEVKSEEVFDFYVGEAEVWLGVYVGYSKGGYCCAYSEELPEGGARSCASVVCAVQQALTCGEASLKLQGEVLVLC